MMVMMMVMMMVIMMVMMMRDDNFADNDNDNNHDNLAPYVRAGLGGLTVSEPRNHVRVGCASGETLIMTML